MGNNGGFNPYRDANGRFAGPESIGKRGAPALRTSTRARNAYSAAAPGPIQGSGYRGKGQDAYGAYTTSGRNPAAARGGLAARRGVAPRPGERVTRSNPAIENFTFNQAKLPFSGLAAKGSGALYKGKRRG